MILFPVRYVSTLISFLTFLIAGNGCKWEINKLSLKMINVQQPRATLKKESTIMKYVKRTMLAILSLVIVGILFRGWIYRHLITYRSVGQRPAYLVTNSKLAVFIDMNMDKKKYLDIKDIIKIGLSATSCHLNYTTTQNDIDPNKLIDSRTAHCVGYASFFATTCNYLIKKNDLGEQWNVTPQIGQLYFMGVNINKCVNTPFFKDHDFVTIENKTTGEIFAVDPTVNDYFFIDFVTYRK